MIGKEYEQDPIWRELVAYVEKQYVHIQIAFRKLSGLRKRFEQLDQEWESPAVSIDNMGNVKRDFLGPGIPERIAVENWSYKVAIVECDRRMFASYRVFEQALLSELRNRFLIELPPTGTLLKSYFRNNRWQGIEPKPEDILEMIAGQLNGRSIAEHSLEHVTHFLKIHLSPMDPVLSGDDAIDFTNGLEFDILSRKIREDAARTLEYIFRLLAYSICGHLEWNRILSPDEMKRLREEAGTAQLMGLDVSGEVPLRVVTNWLGLLELQFGNQEDLRKFQTAMEQIKGKPLARSNL